MTSLEFEAQMARLKSTYGEKNYLHERAYQLFAIVEQTSAKQFEKQVSQWITDSKFPPLGEQFRDFAIKVSKTREHNELLRANEAKVPDCVYCADGGWRYLEMQEDLVQYAHSYGYPLSCAAICNCPVGHKVKHYYENLPNEQDRIPAKSAYNPRVHDQWYVSKLRWEKPTYAGKSLEQFLKEREQDNVLPTS